VILVPGATAAPAAGDWLQTIPAAAGRELGAACACNVTVSPAAVSVAVAWVAASPMTLGTTTAFRGTAVAELVGVGTAVGDEVGAAPAGVGVEVGIAGTGVADGDAVATGVGAPGVVRGACGVTAGRLAPGGVTGVPEFPVSWVATPPSVAPMTTTAAAASVGISHDFRDRFTCGTVISS